MKKRMKYISGLFFVILFGLSLISCEDFLDRQEDEKLTFDKIWESRNTTKQYWLNAMSFLPKENSREIGNDDPYIGASDEASIVFERDFRAMNFGSWNPSSIPYYKMDHYYKGIRECNIFMQNADRCSDPLLDKNELAKWKIQARFARAYYYFMMMRDFGPVFLLGDELLDFTASTQALYRPRSTWEQCVKYVVDEMNICAEDPAMQRQADLSSSEWGFATQGTCYAVISRLRLYSARDLFNGNPLYKNIINPVCENFPEQSMQPLFPQNYDANKWLAAAEAAHEVFEDNSYKLYRAGNNNPYEDYYGIGYQTWNSELIWTDGYFSRFGWGVTTVPTGIAGTAYGGIGPTQQLVDAYAMNDGRYPIIGYNSQGMPKVDDESGYDVENEFAKSDWEYPASGWSSFDNYWINAPNMYKGREPRFYVTVFFSGNKWLHGNSSTSISFAKGGNGNKAHDYPKSGYLCNRFYDHYQNSASDNWGNITFPVFRLGEIYLNFIESVLECKKREVTLPDNYYNEAMEKWADLRNRAGVPPITEVYPNASTEELIELCRKERRIELAFERHRYFDTRTWMIAEQTDAGNMYGMNTSYPQGNLDPTQTPDGFWERSVFETRVFNKNHYLYPFAQREIDRNKLLVQNYGW